MTVAIVGTVLFTGAWVWCVYKYVSWLSFDSKRRRQRERYLQRQRLINSLEKQPSSVIMAIRQAGLHFKFLTETLGK